MVNKVIPLSVDFVVNDGIDLPTEITIRMQRNREGMIVVEIINEKIVWNKFLFNDKAGFDITLPIRLTERKK